MNQLPALSRFLTKQSFTTLLTSSSRTPVWQTLSTNTNKFSTSTEETNSAKPQADANVEELQNLVTEKTSLLEEKTKEVADLKVCSHFLKSFLAIFFVIVIESIRHSYCLLD